MFDFLSYNYSSKFSEGEGKLSQIRIVTNLPPIQMPGQRIIIKQSVTAMTLAGRWIVQFRGIYILVQSVIFQKKWDRLKMKFHLTFFALKSSTLSKILTKINQSMTSRFFIAAASFPLPCLGLLKAFWSRDYFKALGFVWLTLSTGDTIKFWSRLSSETIPNV